MLYYGRSEKREISDLALYSGAPHVGRNLNSAKEMI